MDCGAGASRPNAGPEGGLQLGPSHQIALPFAPMRIAKGRDDRTLAVVGESAGQAVVLDLATESIRLPGMPHELAGFVALSPDGDRLATSGWHSEHVRLWDGQSGKLLQELAVGFISRVFFTPDQRELIVARDREFTFHDLKTLEVSRRMPRDIGLYPGHVAFTSDGKLMALEMAPGLIHLKEITSGRTVAKLEDPQGDHSTWMGFTPDGTQLVVAASYAGAIHRWDLRSIRARLKTMNLDWDWPEFPAPPGETRFAKSASAAARPGPWREARRDNPEVRHQRVPRHTMSEVTRILTAIEQGDARSTDELLPLVYHELRRMAAHKMASEPAGHTLQPTALVHEAWLKLVDSPAISRGRTARTSSAPPPRPCAGF